MYMNVFRSRKRADLDRDAYGRDDKRMVALAEQQPGFVSYKYFVAHDGETVAISIWETHDHARAWGRHPEHLAVRARGQRDYYESYTMYVCIDPGISHFERGKS
jgi:heme-degrading monooxygenase HmoA